jgi:hypothetical protein
VSSVLAFSRGAPTDGGSSSLLSGVSPVSDPSNVGLGECAMASTACEPSSLFFALVVRETSIRSMRVRVRASSDGWSCRWSAMLKIVCEYEIYPSTWLRSVDDYSRNDVSKTAYHNADIVADDNGTY